MSKNVALVLGSGGARGLAHIGAIEALEQRGYTITGIAGCSMGSIIAGMYAAGELPKAKEWFLSVDKQLILRMMDINLLSGNSLVKGQRIIKELEKVVPDRPMETLQIPCSIVATDMIHADEVIFRSGSLFEAVRASISIPLSAEIGNALVDYLVEERPKIKSEYVFLSSDPPFTRLSGHTPIRHLLVKVMNAANIEANNRIYGTRITRHSYASRMLRKGVPIHVISEALGHTNPNTSMIYITTDDENMAKCTLPMPKGGLANE